METPLDLAPSIGVDFYKKTVQVIDLGKVKVQFWDTAGQEKYRSLSSIHTRGKGLLLDADAIVIVLDASGDKEVSLQQLKNWLGFAKEFNDSASNFLF